MYSLAFGSIYLLLAACGGNPKTESNTSNATEVNTTTTTTAPAKQNTNQVASSQDPSSSIPDFKFYILKNGIKFEKSDIKANKTHVFVLFDPSCSHCQHEARDIGKNFGSFKNTEFYFISMNDPALMSTFFTQYAPELNDKENVHLLFDKEMHFIYKFHMPNQYPATYIYRPDGSLKGFWNGEKKIEEIIQAINL